MEDFFRSYWWLLFPLGFFVFGAWDRWLSYKRSQDRLDLLRSYTNQGKDPPPELLRMAHVSFHKPKYDKDGALVRTQISPPERPPSPADPRSTCRVRSGIAGWTASDCKPA